LKKQTNAERERQRDEKEEKDDQRLLHHSKSYPKQSEVKAEKKEGSDVTKERNQKERNNGRFEVFQSYAFWYD